MSAFAVRVFLPKESLRQLVGAWALKSSKVLAYEHTGSKTGKVHTHLLLLGVIDTKNNLKAVAKSMGYELKGNKDWSWKSADADNYETYITYMSKGSIDPWQIKEFDQVLLDDCKSRWVEKYNPDRVLYEKFAKLMAAQMLDMARSNIPLQDHKSMGKILRTEANKFGYLNSGRVINGASRKIAKMCFWTFVQENNLWKQLDDGDKLDINW